MLKKESAQKYWNVRSELFANYYIKPSWFDRIFRKGIYRRSAVALRAIREYEKPTVLDVGSGPGINSVNWLKNSDASFLLGIDFAQNMVEYSQKLAAQEGLSDRTKFISGDFLTYDFEDRRFDISIALGFFDYIANAEEFLQKMGEVSNKAMVASWPRNGLRMALRRMRYTCPVFHYEENQVIEMHKSIGVHNVEIATSGSPGFTTIARIN